MSAGLDVVTGAFSYTGRAIAERLLEQGRRVRTLTRRPEPSDPLAARVEARPLQFADYPALRASLEGADVLYSTYWVRFEHGATTYERTIANTRTLFRTASEAGVRRVVHIGVTNARDDSPLPYFRGKAVLEGALRESGLSYAIVRPTLVFGREDILVNNIAWVLRRFPLFFVPGRGDYLVQPVSVEDTAALAVTAGGQDVDVSLDAAGPEVLSFLELVQVTRRAVRGRARIVHVRPERVLALATLVGRARSDVLLTREELEGLQRSLLVSDAAPTGTDRFSDWVERNAAALGRSYVSELDRNFRPYAPL